MGVIFAICYFSRRVWITLMVSALICFLAIPIMAGIKIICDHIGALQPTGEWMEN
jgi:hypothetical protein